MESWLKKITEIVVILRYSWLGDLVERIFVGLKKAISGIWRQARSRPLKFFQNTFSIVIPLYIVSVFTFNFFSDGIFVDDIKLQGDADRAGRNSRKITEQALDLIPAVIERRIDEARVIRDFGEIIEEAPPGFETDRVCATDILLSPPNTDIYRMALRRAQMSSKTPDSVTNDFFPIKQLAFWVRERMGSRPRTLTPTLTIVDGKFVLRVEEYPYAGLSRRVVFESIDDAPERLASMLVDILAPEVLAAELVSTRKATAEALKFPRDAAALFLQDEQKSLFIALIISTLELERNNEKSMTSVHLLRYLDFNKNLLNRLDFLRFGDDGVVLKSLLSWRIVRSELDVEIFRSGMKINPVDTIDKYFSPLRKDLMKQVHGRFLWFMIQQHAGRKDIAFAGMKKIIEDLSVDLRLRRRFAVLMLNLIMSYSFEDAAVEIQRLDYLFVGANYNDEALSLLNAIRAAIAALKRDVVQAEAFINKIPNEHQCARHAMYGLVDNYKMKGNQVSSDVSKMIARIFVDGDSGVLKSFHHYNTLGSWLADAGRFKEAYDYFQRALRHQGDPAWAYLNWASAARKEGNHSLAEEMSKKSLSMGTVANAVRQLLVAQASLSKEEEFLSNVARYHETIMRLDHPMRSDFERVRIGFSCGDKENLTKSLLKDGESIDFDGKKYSREEFQTIACSASGDAQKPTAQ